jgi:hypothetical protein
MRWLLPAFLCQSQRQLLPRSRLRIHPRRIARSGKTGSGITRRRSASSSLRAARASHPVAGRWRQAAAPTHFSPSQVIASRVRPGIEQPLNRALKTPPLTPPPEPTLFKRPVGRTAAADLVGVYGPSSRIGGGKSGLHGDTVAANGRRGRPQGKCHRKQTASSEVRVKGCGKSAPRVRRRTWQGKPHREQDQIGAAGRARKRGARCVSRPAARVGCLRRAAMCVPDEWPSRLRARPEGRQNPAYRPTGILLRALPV